MRVGIAADHAGLALKERMIGELRESGNEVLDFRPSSLTPESDYPDHVVPLVRSMVSGEVERGVATCGSGVGARVLGCALAWDLAKAFLPHVSLAQNVTNAALAT